ncbi:MAG: DUF3857 domain-containing protein [Pseudomonadota bacterium]
MNAVFIERPSSFSSTLTKATVSALALTLASLAQAGENPVYGDNPSWIEVVDLENIEADETNDLVLFDQQIRIEEGQRWDYQDKVTRISAITDLSKAGTLKVRWSPDKGDLIVHELSILRGGEILDVLTDDVEFEILRRERQLERGVLDGMLTATLAVPGLAVDDQLRFRYSITTSDQALGKEVQSQTFLRREPSKTAQGRFARLTNSEADFSRVRVSWPEGLDVRYQAGPNFQIGDVETRGGYNWLEVVTPLPAADRLPSAVPQRYRRPTTLQASTFADWAEVSSVMAPYYEAGGSLEGQADLLEKVDAIAAQPVSELEKAIDALELVQEDVRYLMNGLDGGNYLPQDVATTWDMKFGDCKAKTVLLLALLDRLGIEAEAVLVSTNRGNAVPVSLPLPGAFNHVLVRAVIEGQEYFLDGTSVGANIKTVGNVPPFEHYLAIRDSGADLAPIVQTLPRVAEQEMHLEFDGTAGADLPTLGVLKIHVLGPRAARMNAESDKFKDAFKSGFATGFGKRAQVVDAVIEPGEDDSEATVTMTAILPSFFKFEGTRGVMTPGRFTKSAKFAPNRSLRQWRDIPVAIGRPGAQVMSVRGTLPFEANAMKVEGVLNLDAEAAGKRFVRKVEFDGPEVYVFEKQINSGGEIDADQIREERRKAAKVVGSGLTLVAPPDTPRRWRFATGADRAILAPLEEALAKVIADEPEEAQRYAARARFREQTYDFVGARSDLSKAIELEATAQFFEQRARMHVQLGDLVLAREDYEEAYALDSTPSRAINLAEAMAEVGEIEEALEVLLLESGNTQDQQILSVATAQLEARQGDPLSGLERIAQELIKDPNDPSLLNSKCWLIGTWEVALEEGADACRLAVERGQNTAQALDSRAMYQLRMGKLDRARGDIEEALRLSPWQAASLLLRGLIKREQGDETAEQDIAEALARRPSLALTYKPWGFDLTR